MKTSVNRKFSTLGLRVSALTGITLLAACASLPPNPQLEALQNRYEIMSGQPFASQEAGKQLDATRDALALGREAYMDHDDDALAHYIIVADKNLDIVETRVQLHEANEQIASASETRETMLREARERELAIADAQVRAAEGQVARQGVALEAQREALATREAQLRAQQQALNQTSSQLNQTEAELAAAEAELSATQRQAQLLADQLVEVTTTINERGTVLVLSDIVFDFDSARLRPGSDRALDEIAKFLNQEASAQLKIEGHTDALGTDDYNQELSEERADSVRDALVERGVDDERISVAGYGEEYPVASNDSDAGRQLNRRVEIVLDDKIGSPVSPISAR